MTDTFQNIVKVESLNISDIDIINMFRGRGEGLPDFFREAVKDSLEKVIDQNVLIGYRVFPVQITKEEIIIENHELEINREVFNFVKNSEKAVLFACTVTPQLNIFLNTFNDISEQYVKDVTGTLIIEKTRDFLYEHIKNYYSRFKTTNLLSPGNCGWPMEAQKTLFKLLPDSFLGISLSQSGMMSPLKSLSGIVGLGSNVKYKHTDCRQCPSTNCIYRKKEYYGV